MSFVKSSSVAGIACAWVLATSACTSTLDAEQRSEGSAAQQFMVGDGRQQRPVSSRLRVATLDTPPLRAPADSGCEDARPTREHGLYVGQAGQVQSLVISHDRAGSPVITTLGVEAPDMDGDRFDSVQRFDSHGCLLWRQTITVPYEDETSERWDRQLEASVDGSIVVSHNGPGVADMYALGDHGQVLWHTRLELGPPETVIDGLSVDGHGNGYLVIVGRDGETLELQIQQIDVLGHAGWSRVVGVDERFVDAAGLVDGGVSVLSHSERGAVLRSFDESGSTMWTAALPEITRAAELRQLEVVGSGRILVQRSRPFPAGAADLEYWEHSLIEFGPSASTAIIRELGQLHGYFSDNASAASTGLGGWVAVESRECGECSGSLAELSHLSLTRTCATRHAPFCPQQASILYIRFTDCAGALRSAVHSLALVPAQPDAVVVYGDGIVQWRSLASEAAVWTRSNFDPEPECVAESVAR